MEDLLRYCVHELAFDGDLGCNIDRLKVLVRSYYEGLQPSFVQNLDDAFLAFIWRLLRQQPSIQIKLIKETSLEVYIAPQKSKKAKADKDTSESTPDTGTELIEEAKTLSLNELLQTYGNGLRIAVDPETCFRALTGSHIRQPKLTPMVYTALQLISRYREEGLSVVDLGKKTGYDQKTCFYLVKQLLSMDYIVKLAKGGSGGGNFCIHKSFYLRSSFWQGIRDETTEINQDQEGAKQHGGLFAEMDSRHLASPELIKSRITKLLKMSENGLHYYHNLLVTIGFSKPAKKDRRFFINRVRDLIKEKVIEKVLVPRKGKQSSKALCIRLVEDPRNSLLDGVVVQNDDVGDEEQEQGEEAPESSGKSTKVEIEMPLLHMTIQRQVVQLLEEAGADGMTLNDISTRLGAFDKRTLDLLLHRLVNPASPHLADTGICVFLENSGRERRNRYFTLSGYNEFIRTAKIDVTERSGTKNQSGTFNVASTQMFYRDERELKAYEDNRINPSKTSSRKVGRKSKLSTKLPGNVEDEIQAPSSSRGKKRRASGEVDSTSVSTSIPKNKRARLSKENDRQATLQNNEDLSANLESIDTSNTACSVALVRSDPMDDLVVSNQIVDEATPTPNLSNIQEVTFGLDLSTPNTTVPSKRSIDQHDSGESSTKRIKSEKTKRSTVNLSHLRAENEIIRVVHEFGGISNVASKEFFEMHSKVLASLEANGEPISMPVGAQLDRRSLRKILDRLVERNRLKMLTTTITPRSVQPRVAKLIYIPDMSKDKIDNFINSLQDPVPAINNFDYKELEDAIDFSRPHRNLASQFDLSLGTLAKPDRTTKGRGTIDFTGSDEEIRTRLLADSRTSSQVFGFILGKARRARELHQFTLYALSNSAESTNVVSGRNRIICLPYYFHDIPVSTYFSIISASGYNQDLYDLMKTPSGRLMRIGDLPASLYETLQIGKTRSRSRILDLMEVLMSLGLVTPLRPSSSTAPPVTCSPSGTHPSSYDICFTSSDSSNLSKMAFYWQFQELAPVYNYSQPEWPPSFRRDMFVRTPDESVSYWDELEKACLDKKDSIVSTSAESMTGPCKCVLPIAQTLRKRPSWSSAYMLSWEQEQYLQQKWTNPSTGYTPLSDEDGGRRTLIHICEIISAPFDTVYNYFLGVHQAFQREIRRMRKKKQREGVIEGHDLEEKARLAQTIAKSKQQLASDWDSLIQQVHPGISSRKLATLASLKNLRVEYMRCKGSIAPEEWKTRISEALATSGMRDRPTLATRAKSTRGSRGSMRELTHEGPSVRELVQKLKDTTLLTAQERKNRGTDKISANRTRSRRFNWTAEYDELARDASAILRSRCRSWGRMDWTALDELFPSIPRNNVRQRIATLRQEPGGESYFRRLEDEWHRIWLEYRQTELLPDPNPDHPSGFDLIAHVEFLRRNINKSALKLGSLDSNTEDLGCVLSEDISQFFSKWEVTEYPSSVDNVDVMWSSAAEEQREIVLLRQAFVIGRPQYSRSLPPQVDRLPVAESALKMVLLTPDHRYDPNLASSFLESVDKRNVRLATENLLSRGIIIEATKSDRQTPGRKMRVTDLNQEASGGFFRPEFYKQALAIDEVLEEDIDESKEWDLLAQGGQMAALVDLVSRGETKFTIDVSEPKFHRKELDWNSKKVDDDQIEATISAFYRPLYSNFESKLQDMSTKSPRVDTGLEAHEPPAGSACCLRSSGVVDCSSCIDLVHNRFLQSTTEKTQLYLKIVRQIEDAGSDGLTHIIVYDHLFPDAERLQLLHAMLSASPPLCHWTGYDQPVLVSARHIRPWTVLLPKPPTTYIFPRRWIDFNGVKTIPLWQSALCAVASILFLRPGLSLAQLRRKLVSVYDRQDVNDILQFLSANNFIATSNPSRNSPFEFHQMDISDEEHLALFLTSTERWYDISREEH